MNNPIYSPEADDDWPPWRVRAFNALVGAIWLAFLALVGAALWALWAHPWLVPIIAVPLLAWAYTCAAWAVGEVNPTASPEPCEEPGPPPRRHLTAAGKRIVFFALVIVAAVVLAVLYLGPPSRFGPVGW